LLYSETHLQMGEITLLLEEMAHGNRGLEGQLLDTIYPELHRVAARLMRNERANHTLQPTALVNEAYMRLVGDHPISWESRLHFLNAAAQVMRRILIDHARAMRTTKRSGGVRVELKDTLAVSMADPETLISVNDALTRLEGIDKRMSQVVELRYFGGLSVEETAQVLKTSPKTVKRDWAMARAWLEGELRATI
jgi:RNA polymerase sigma-70 factor (ECF subfamily)